METKYKRENQMISLIILSILQIFRQQAVYYCKELYQISSYFWLCSKGGITCTRNEIIAVHGLFEYVYVG